jgi:Zn-finger nucleic acid-binding protein
MSMGLTFIGVAHSSIGRQDRVDDERARQARLARFRDIIRGRREVLSERDRAVLDRIAQQLTADDPPNSSLACPECDRPMTLVTVDDVEIDCCRYCRSIWFDEGELLAFSQQDRDVPSDHLHHRPSRFACPACRGPMIEYVFQNPRTLMVDRCPTCRGVYLEDRELQRVFEIGEMDPPDDGDQN